MLEGAVNAAPNSGEPSNLSVDTLRPNPGSMKLKIYVEAHDAALGRCSGP